MRRWASVVGVVASSLPFGCIAIPIPLPEDTVLAGKELTREEVAFLASTGTTRQDVLSRLGQPTLIWEDARIYIYLWDMRQGGVFIAVAGNSTAAAEWIDVPRHYLLLIEFDDAWRVRRFDRTTRQLLESGPEFLIRWRGKTSDAVREAGSEP